MLASNETEAYVYGNKFDAKWYNRCCYEMFDAIASIRIISRSGVFTEIWYWKVLGMLVSVYLCLCPSWQSCSTFPTTTLARIRSCLASKLAFPFPVIRTSARKLLSTKNGHRRFGWSFATPRRCQRFSGPSLRFTGTFRTLITIDFISEWVLFQIRVLALRHMEL